MKKSYPGYKSVCNGCGLCCLSVPCAVADQFGLWRNGECRALQELPDGYVCKVITNPRSVSVRLNKIPKQDRLNAIGSLGICDHRAAWSLDDVYQLLNERNAADEIFKFDGDTYPRVCILHLDDGKYFCIQYRADQELEMERLIA